MYVVTSYDYIYLAGRVDYVYSSAPLNAENQEDVMVVVTIISIHK